MNFQNYYDLFSILPKVAASSFLGFDTFITIHIYSQKNVLKKNSQSESVYLFSLDFFKAKKHYLWIVHAKRGEVGNVNENDRLSSF